MNQKLSNTFDLPNQLIDKLKLASIYTINDLLAKCPMDLIKILNIPLSRVIAILEGSLSRSISVPNSVDALMLFKNHQECHIDLDKSDIFDTILNKHELLKTGILTEICGPPGVGKTQFLQKICSTYLLDLNKSDHTVIYIDTENNFSPYR